MKVFKHVAAAVMMVFLLSLTAGAQTKDAPKEPQKKGAPLTDAQKKWLEEVFYIISDYEKNAFVNLKSDEDRERFVTAFWENRDPTPGTEKNEYKDEHYTRWKYVNRMFGRITPLPGWKTDRGKIYMLMGKPEFIKRQPNPFEFFPMELWQYAGYRGYGLPGSLYIMFYQDGGIGDYKQYSPIHDGVEALFVKTFTHQGKTEQELYDYLRRDVDPEMAHAAFSMIPTEGGSAYDANVGQIGAEMIQTKIDNARNWDLDKRKYVEDFIFERPTVQVYTSIETGGIRDGIYWFQAPNGLFYLDYVVEYEPDKLDLGQYENYYTSLTIDGVVATPEKVQVEQILSSHEINLTEAQFDKIKSLPFQFQGRRPLVPGKYELTLIMNNNVSRRSITFTHDIEIPSPSTIKAPVISPLIPLRSVEKLSATDKKLRPFQYEDQVATPNVRGLFSQQGSMQVYHQVMFPKDFAAGAGPLALHYQIIGATTEATVVETLTLPAAELAGNSIDVRKDIPLNEVTLGTKKLIVELRSGDKVLATSEAAVITLEPTVDTGVWKYAVSIPDYDSSFHPFSVAMQLMKMQKTNQALGILQQAYQKYPESLEIRLQLMRAALKAEKFQVVVDLGTPMEVKNPRDKELLWLLGWAHYGLGKFEDSIKFFERYRLEDPKRVEVLNLLADIYFRLDQKEKSMERIEQSLALRPDQQDLQDLKKKIQESKQ